MEGTAASPGIAIGSAFLLFGESGQAIGANLGADDHDIELNRFYQALNEALDDIEMLQKKVQEKIGKKEAHIFSFQKDIIAEEEFSEKVTHFIKEEGLSAEKAVQRVIRQYAAELANSEDTYIKVDENDIKDIGERLINLLQGQDIKLDISQNNIIIVARELSPSQIARLDPKKVLGLVTAEGSSTSHSAILANSMGLPAVVGIGEENLARISQGDTLIVDGKEGQVYLNPPRDMISDYRKKQSLMLWHNQELNKYRDKKLIRADGSRLYVSGNIGNSSEALTVKQNGGEGIGLFRTEFLYLGREKAPDEEEQLQAFAKALEHFPEDPVIIRTMDIGGDKEIPGLNLPAEENPFLGYRAIRVCLDNRDYFKVQLRAILRAAARGEVKLMYPMISSLEEVRSANTILREARGELDAAGKEYGELDVGIMIEIPAAIAMARELSREVDFFSLGTNDLIQYAVAVDRSNERIKDLHTPFHPGVLRMITRTVMAAKEAGIKVYMCGEAAGEKLLLPFWLGLGIDQLSMSPGRILEAKSILSEWLNRDTREVIEEVLAKSTTAEIQYYLSRLFHDNSRSPVKSKQGN